MLFTLGAAALGAAAGYGINKYNQNKARSNAKFSSDLEYEYAKRYALNAPSWNVQGMRDAGINPILGAQAGTLGDVTLNGASVASTPWSMSDVNGSAQVGNDMKKNKLQESMNEGQLNNLETNSALNVANTAKSNAEAEATTMRAQADVELKKIQAMNELENLVSKRNENLGAGLKSSMSFGGKKGFSFDLHASDVPRSLSKTGDFITRDLHPKVSPYSPPNSSFDSNKSYIINSPRDSKREVKFYDPEVQKQIKREVFFENQRDKALHYLRTRDKIRRYEALDNSR